MMARATPKTAGAADGGFRVRLLKYWKPKEYLLGFVFVAALGLGGAWGSWQNLCAGDACPSIAQISTFEHEQKSKILAIDGRQIAEFGFESRTPVSIRALPEYVAQAVVATEDRRFYEHRGFDPIGIARAVVGVVTFNYAGGGSTITQQLARNMFDEIGFERRYVRKLKEVQVALDLERSYTKEQILEAYLNEIYMGRGYGFQNAARGYLGKNATDMNVAEAALLTAILNVPARYDPFRFPERAKARRDLVLDLMARAEYLTLDEARRWKDFPLPESEPEGSVTSIAPYFEEWVRQILDDRFGAEVYSGGFRVYTTLDIDMQRAAQAAMEAGWAEIEADTMSFRHPLYSDFDTVTSFPGSTPYLQGAFIALDPETGYVLALIGGRDYGQSKFDRARLAQRQAGSSFKPFVYTAAIATGIPASYVLEDNAVVYPQVSGEDWRPSNFTEEFRGPMTIREGLYTSTNMIAIKLGWEEVGIETVAQTARRMGIHTVIERFPSTTIGASAVIPIEVAEAYSAYPNLGTKVTPFPILRVEDANGNVVWEPQPERTVVLDSLPARIMVDMLQDVVRLGTGYNAIRVRAGLPTEVPAAGKTGTTNDGTDIWFTGFTPNLLATVWFGMDSPVPLFRLGPGRRQATGGGLAAPVWGAFMRRVYEGVEADEDNGTLAVAPLRPIPNEWPMLPGLNAVLVDRKTGQLASRWCPQEDQYVEYYIPGTEPTELCDRSSRRFRFPRIN
ncbi:MAG: PBP1A family penicillin-binding protein [Gemmatimonadetes bacterium]|nr:PBP1A family penicillin-binding protein [Gemmatimonadota bacterium]MDA1104777.1 PBP1A family penicillin-binding protein [Gemmatimonadota bacterium]